MKTVEVQSLSGLESGRLYGAKVVSKCIGIHERTITGLANKGEIGYHAMGKRKLFSKADVEEYLKRTYRPANARRKDEGGKAGADRERGELALGGTGKEGK